MWKLYDQVYGLICKVLDYRPVQIVMSLLIVFGMVAIVFTPNYFLFKLGARYANYLMLAYLLSGIGFLIFRQQQLMFVSFACCATLCMYLRHSSDQQLKLPEPTNSRAIRVAHFNLSSSNLPPEVITDYIIMTEADLISLQEVTPDWVPLIETKLKKHYPHQSLCVRMDPFGLAAISRYPINALDTFYFDQVPNLMGNIRLAERDKPVHFIMSHTTPPLFSKAYESLRDHLRTIAHRAKQLKDPVLTIGEYNAPPWWSEIQRFKEFAELEDCRMSATQGFRDIFESPVDYILYSKHFQCVDFEGLADSSAVHIGITGTFEFNSYQKREELSGK